MSCFTGRMHEYERISLDRFDSKNLQSTVYFLSHLHEDHTVGLALPMFWNRLRTNKDVLLYCSEVTEVLIGASDKYKHLLPYVKSLAINCPTTIEIPDPLYDEKEVVTVTFLPAFHCPGSVMCLFEGHEGTVLYTGDFRWEHFQLEQMHHLRSGQSVKQIKSVYIDTTFCNMNTLYIPSRQHCIDAVYQLVREWTQQSPDHMVYISLRAQYGHEPLLNAVATRLNTKVHVSGRKLAVYEQIKEFCGHFTSDGSSTQVHACGKEVMTMMEGVSVPCFSSRPRDRVLVILPTTMYFTQSQQLSLDKIVRRMSDGLYRACYSFHSSYTEIQDLLSYLAPTNVYPNVIAVGDGSLSVTQHRLNTMLKECTVRAAADSKAVMMAGDPDSKLGTLKVRRGRRNIKRKDTESSAESLDFGTPVKSRRLDPSPSEVDQASSSKRGQGRGRGRGKRSLAQTPPDESPQKTRTSTRLRVRRSADVETLQATPTKQLRPGTPDLFATAGKSDSDNDDNDSSYAGSHHSDGEMDLTCSQKSVEFGASGEEIPTGESSAVWQGSFLAAVSSSTSDEGSSSVCVIENDNDQTDIFFTDVSQIVDDGEGIQSSSIMPIVGSDVKKSSEMNTDEHNQNIESPGDNRPIEPEVKKNETGETVQTNKSGPVSLAPGSRHSNIMDNEKIEDDIAKPETGGKITPKGRKINKRKSATKGGKSGGVPNTTNINELKQTEDTVEQTKEVPNVDKDDTSKDVPSDPDAGVHESPTRRRSGHQRKSNRKYENTETVDNSKETLVAHEDVPMKDSMSSPKVTNAKGKITKSSDITLKTPVRSEQETSSNDMELVSDSKISSTDDSTDEHERGAVATSAVDVNTEGGTCVEEMSCPITAEKQGGTCVEEMSCPITAEKQGGTCVEEMSCPITAEKQGGTCVEEMSCPITAEKQGRTCVEEMSCPITAEKQGGTCVEEISCPITAEKQTVSEPGTDDCDKSMDSRKSQKDGGSKICESETISDEVIEKGTSDVDEAVTTKPNSAAERSDDGNRDVRGETCSEESTETSGNNHDISSEPKDDNGIKMLATEQDHDSEHNTPSTEEKPRSSIESDNILTIHCEEESTIETNDNSTAERPLPKDTCNVNVTKASDTVSGINGNEVDEDVLITCIEAGDGGEGGVAAIQELVPAGEIAVEDRHDHGHTDSQSSSFEETQRFDWDDEEESQNDANSISEFFSVENDETDTENLISGQTSDIDSDCEILDVKPELIEIDLTSEIDESVVVFDTSSSETDKCRPQNVSRPVSRTSNSESPTSRIRKLRFVRRSSFDLFEENPKDTSIEDFNVSKHPTPNPQPPDIDWCKYLEPQKDLNAEYYKFLSEISEKDSHYRTVTISSVNRSSKRKLSKVKKDVAPPAVVEDDDCIITYCAVKIKSESANNDDETHSLTKSHTDDEKESDKNDPLKTQSSGKKLLRISFGKPNNKGSRKAYTTFSERTEIDLENEDLTKDSENVTENIDSLKTVDTELAHVEANNSVELHSVKIVTDNVPNNASKESNQPISLESSEGTSVDVDFDPRKSPVIDVITSENVEPDHANISVDNVSTNKISALESKKSAEADTANVNTNDVINIDSSCSSGTVTDTEIINLDSSQLSEENVVNTEMINLTSTQSPQDKPANSEGIDNDSVHSPHLEKSLNVTERVSDTKKSEDVWLSCTKAMKGPSTKSNSNEKDEEHNEVKTSDNNTCNKSNTTDEEQSNSDNQWLFVLDTNNRRHRKTSVQNNMHELEMKDSNSKSELESVASAVKSIQTKILKSNSEEDKNSFTKIGNDSESVAVDNEPDTRPITLAEPSPRLGDSEVDCHKTEPELSNDVIICDSDGLEKAETHPSGNYDSQVSLYEDAYISLSDSDSVAEVEIDDIPFLDETHKEKNKAKIKNVDSKQGERKGKQIENVSKKDLSMTKTMENDVVDEAKSTPLKGKQKQYDKDDANTKYGNTMHRAQQSKKRAIKIKHSIDLQTNNKEDVSERKKQRRSGFLSKHDELLRKRDFVQSMKCDSDKNLSRGRDDGVDGSSHYRTVTVSSENRSSKRKLSKDKKDVAPPGVAFPILYKNIPPPTVSSSQTSLSHASVPPPVWPNFTVPPMPFPIFGGPNPAVPPVPFPIFGGPNPAVPPVPFPIVSTPSAQNLSGPIAFIVPPPALPFSVPQPVPPPALPFSVPQPVPPPALPFSVPQPTLPSPSNSAAKADQKPTVLGKMTKISPANKNVLDKEQTEKVKRLLASVLQNASVDNAVQNVIGTVLKSSQSNDYIEMSKFPSDSGTSETYDQEASESYRHDTSEHQPQGGKRVDNRSLHHRHNVRDDPSSGYSQHESDKHGHRGPPSQRDDPFTEARHVDDEARYMDEHDRPRHPVDSKRAPMPYHHHRRDSYDDQGGTFHDRPDPCLDRLDPFHEQRDKYLDRPDPCHDQRYERHDPVDPYDRLDSYHDRHDPYLDRRDPYLDRHDPYHERLDSYLDGRDPYLDRYDPYHERRDPYLDRDPYFDRHDPYGRPDPRHDPYHDRVDPDFDRREPYGRVDPDHDPCDTLYDPDRDRRDPYRQPRIRSPDPHFSHNDRALQPKLQETYLETESHASQYSYSSEAPNSRPPPTEHKLQHKSACAMYRPGTGMEHPEDSLSRLPATSHAMQNAHGDAHNFSTKPLLNTPATKKNSFKQNKQKTEKTPTQNIFPRNSATEVKRTAKNFMSHNDVAPKPKFIVLSRSNKYLGKCSSMAEMTQSTSRAFKQHDGPSSEGTIQSEAATDTPAFVTGLTNFKETTIGRGKQLFSRFTGISNN